MTTGACLLCGRDGNVKHNYG